MEDEIVVDASSRGITANERLDRIAADLRSGKETDPVSVRELLSWFGVQRRGSFNCYYIQSALDEAGLTTEPDFVVPYIDSLIKFQLKESGAPGSSDQGSPAAEVISFPLGEPATDDKTASSASAVDPTYRIGRLRWANVVPTSVSPNHTVTEAITIMLANDFSQLPVMVGEREVKGVVSWSSIGSRLALGIKCTEVRECMDSPHIITSDTSLFDAITEIVKNQYVLIRDTSNKISGIVTTSDLSLEFRQLTEPFLLLAEIENHVRRLIHRGAYSTEQLRDCCDPKDSDRAVNGVFDLNFGDYIRLLEKKELWTQLQLSIDRVIFTASLDKVREIRNDVMHFDPDGITQSDLDALRKFVSFLQRLQPVLHPDLR
jgi:CBS domain-containing protein